MEGIASLPALVLPQIAVRLSRRGRLPVASRFHRSRLFVVGWTCLTANF